MTYCPFTDDECINKKLTCSECILNNPEDIEEDFLTDEENEYHGYDPFEDFDTEYMIMFTNNMDYLPLTEDELPF